MALQSLEQTIQNDSKLSDLYYDLMRLPIDERIKVTKIFYQEMHDRMVPPLDDFLFDPDYLGFKESQIYKPVRQALHIIDDPTVREVYICAGKGSGKSTIVGLAQARALYRVLSYINPADYFGLAEGSYLGLINMSISGVQALNVIFKKFLEFISRIKEFQKVSKRNFIKYKETSEDQNYKVREFMNTEKTEDVEHYSETIGMIAFPDKSITCISGHSRFTSFFGYDILFGSIDEWSWFETGKERVSSDIDEMVLSEEIYQGLVSAGITRFPEHYKFVGISTPRSRTNDPLWGRYEDVKNSGERVERITL